MGAQESVLMPPMMLFFNLLEDVDQSQYILPRFFFTKKDRLQPQ